jgi:hypothetical protein
MVSYKSSAIYFMVHYYQRSGETLDWGVFYSIKKAHKLRKLSLEFVY